MNKKINIKTCFIICPLGDIGSDIRDHSNWVYSRISEALLNKNIRIDRADKINQSGCINSQVMEHVVKSDLVIADLTEMNPNVFFELGWRYAIQKPFIQIIKKNQKLPFDIATTRTIIFDLYKPEEFKDDILRFVESIETEGFPNLYSSLARYYKVETEYYFKEKDKFFKEPTHNRPKNIFMIKLADGGGAIHLYRQDGKHIGVFNDETPHPYDITEIIPKK